MDKLVKQRFNRGTRRRRFISQFLPGKLRERKTEIRERRKRRREGEKKEKKILPKDVELKGEVDFPASSP